MKYEFGVMSTKYSLEAEDKDVAKICMVLTMNTSAPIAIYDPEPCLLDPKAVLLDVDKTRPNIDKVKACMKTVVKLL